MIPWRALGVFLSIAVGTMAVIGGLSALNGWTVHSPVWGVLMWIAMWAPACGRFVACRTVDRGFRSTLPLGRWGDTGAQVIVLPLAIPFAVYAAAYAIASSVGLAHWNPGGGKWTTPAQIAANVAVNLAILGVIGTLTALGEEIGWRGYLQPRLDAAGVRTSIIVVSLCQVAYHAPVIAGAGYSNTGSLVASLMLFAVGDLPFTFISAHESYRARSLWPAVFLHSFHNTISQWVFPRFFAGGDNEHWLAEGGLLPMAGYIAAGALFWLWMRRRGLTWRELAGRALTTTVPRAVVTTR